MTKERNNQKKTPFLPHSPRITTYHEKNNLTKCNILSAALVALNRIAKISRLNTMGKRRAGRQSRNRPNKTPRSKNAIQDLAGSHTPEHQTDAKNNIMHEETTDHHNNRNAKLPPSTSYLTSSAPRDDAAQKRPQKNPHRIELIHAYHCLSLTLNSTAQKPPKNTN